MYYEPVGHDVELDEAVGVVGDESGSLVAAVEMADQIMETVVVQFPQLDLLLPGLGHATLQHPLEHRRLGRQLTSWHL